MIHRICFLDFKAALPNDNTDFPLIVDSIGKPRMRKDRITVCNYTRRPLCEDHRMGWLINLVARVITGCIELNGMLKIVFSNS